MARHCCGVAVGQLHVERQRPAGDSVTDQRPGRRGRELRVGQGHGGPPGKTIAELVCLVHIHHEELLHGVIWHDNLLVEDTVLRPRARGAPAGPHCRCPPRVRVLAGLTRVVGSHAEVVRAEGVCGRKVQGAVEVHHEAAGSSGGQHGRAVGHRAARPLAWLLKATASLAMRYEATVGEFSYHCASVAAVGSEPPKMRCTESPRAA
mmetsp:Transcript_106958/g.345142  ORF Transcript_106958/g.345142 Transcript_106958/m.345142 type:complete len:206 (+) Transcript_106958:645-1262(+)